jgi:hypothetical protein
MLTLQPKLALEFPDTLYQIPKNRTRRNSIKSTESTDFKKLLARATPGQIQEAARLHRIYGTVDPKIVHRYLLIVQHREIPSELKSVQSGWDCNELLESLPAQWRADVLLFVDQLSCISPQAILDHLLPDNKDYFEGDNPGEEPVPIYDPYDKERTLNFIQDFLIEKGWTDYSAVYTIASKSFIRNYLRNHAQKLNPRVLYNKKISIENILLAARQFEYIDAVTILENCNLSQDKASIQHIQRVLVSSGFEPCPPYNSKQPWFQKYTDTTIKYTYANS